jgi:hypothetical protein
VRRFVRDREYRGISGAAIFAKAPHSTFPNFYRITRVPEKLILAIRIYPNPGRAQNRVHTVWATHHTRIRRDVPPARLHRTRSIAMKAKTIVSALILSAATIGTAHAQLTPFQGVYGKQYSDVTRDQVVQEMRAARAAGLTGNEDMDNQPFTAQKESDADRTGVATNADHDPSGLANVKFGDTDNVPFQG